MVLKVHLCFTRTFLTRSWTRSCVDDAVWMTGRTNAAAGRDDLLNALGQRNCAGPMADPLLLRLCKLVPPLGATTMLALYTHTGAFPGNKRLLQILLCLARAVHFIAIWRWCLPESINMRV